MKALRSGTPGLTSCLACDLSRHVTPQPPYLQHGSNKKPPHGAVLGFAVINSHGSSQLH